MARTKGTTIEEGKTESVARIDEVEKQWPEAKWSRVLVPLRGREMDYKGQKVDDYEAMGYVVLSRETKHTRHQNLVLMGRPRAEVERENRERLAPLDIVNDPNGRVRRISGSVEQTISVGAPINPDTVSGFTPDAGEEVVEESLV